MGWLSEELEALETEDADAQDERAFEDAIEWWFDRRKTDQLHSEIEMEAELEERAFEYDEIP